MHRPVLVAVATALAVGGCGGFGQGAPAPTSPTTSAPTSPTTGATSAADGLVLGVPDATSGRCRPPDAALLRRQDLAVRGEVVGAGGAGTVRLRVLDSYRGEPGPVVEVDAVPDALADLLLAPDLEPGATVLLAARGGTLAVCGVSGAATPILTRLYERAYGVPR